MKKLIFSLCLSTSVICLCYRVNAQTNPMDLLAKNESPRPVSGSAHSYYLNNLNFKMLRHFAKTFPNPSEENWSRTGDQSRVTFKSYGIGYMVDYFPNGNWRSTIMTYGPEKLDRSIKTQVAGAYEDYNIEMINELRIGNKKAYFITLSGLKNCKKIRVMDHELEELDSFELK